MSTNKKRQYVRVWPSLVGAKFNGVKLSPVDVYILGFLFNKAAGNVSVRAGHRYIAKGSNVSLATTSRSLKTLQDAKLIRMTDDNGVNRVWLEDRKALEYADVMPLGCPQSDDTPDDDTPNPCPQDETGCPQNDDNLPESVRKMSTGCPQNDDKVTLPYTSGFHNTGGEELPPPQPSLESKEDTQDTSTNDIEPSFAVGNEGQPTTPTPADIENRLAKVTELNKDSTADNTKLPSTNPVDTKPTNPVDTQSADRERWKAQIAKLKEEAAQWRQQQKAKEAQSTKPVDTPPIQPKPTPSAQPTPDPLAKYSKDAVDATDTALNQNYVCVVTGKDKSDYAKAYYNSCAINFRSDSTNDTKPIPHVYVSKFEFAKYAKDTTHRYKSGNTCSYMGRVLARGSVPVTLVGDEKDAKEINALWVEMLVKMDGVLVLDGCLDKYVTSNPNALLMENLKTVIAERKNWGKETILTTNLTKAQVESLYGDDIASLLSDWVTIQVADKPATKKVA